MTSTRRRLFADVRPLKNGQFRGLWLSSLLSGLGGQMGVFAVALQVFRMTGSPFAVGTIGLFVAGPTIAFAMWGGALADAVDRRKLMIVATLAQLLISLALFGLVTIGPVTVGPFTVGSGALWPIYLLVALQATFGAVAVPSRRVFLRRLLPPASLPAGLILYSFSASFSQIAGPLVAGFVTASVGIAACFLVQAAGFVASLVAVLRLPPMPADDAPPTPGVKAIRQALGFIGRSSVLRSTFIIDLSMTFLATPIALLPSLNAERFGGGSESLGFLTASVAAGGVIGTVFSGFVGGLLPKGRALIMTALLWCLIMIGVGLSQPLILVIALLALSGAVDVVSVALGQTISQRLCPDSMRGRISSAEQIVQMGGPQLGAFRAGAVGSVLGSAEAIVIGGVSGAIVIGALGLTQRSLSRYVDADAG